MNIPTSKSRKNIVSDKGFESFDKLKKCLGSPGEGNAFHHIVEKSQILKSGFSAKKIHNVKNIIEIPHGKGTVHAKISGLYNSKQLYTGNLIVREWLAGKSFQEQFDFGMNVLKKYGDVVETAGGWVFTPFEE